MTPAAADAGGEHTTGIAVFGYRRAGHIAECLDSLRRCLRLDECAVTVYMDGAKGAADAEDVRAARDAARARATGVRATIVERSTNLGLARSIVDGVGAQLQQHGRVIVIEDDLRFAPGFVDFMLQSLDRYQDETRVFHVGAFMFPFDLSTRDDVVLLPWASSWGWGTWRRAWRSFAWPPVDLARLDDPGQARRFDMDGAFPYSRLLRDQANGRSDSWAVLWAWAMFREGGLAAHPTRSMVRNLGFEGSGVHCGPWNAPPQRSPEDLAGDTLGRPLRFPPAVTVDDEAWQALRRQMRKSIEGPSFSDRVVRAVRRLWTA